MTRSPLRARLERRAWKHREDFLALDWITARELRDLRKKERGEYDCFN